MLLRVVGKNDAARYDEEREFDGGSFCLGQEPE
jgi:hypothetical protein